MSNQTPAQVAEQVRILIADQAATRNALKALDSNIQEVLAQVQASMLSLAQSVSILARQVGDLQESTRPVQGDGQ